MESYIGLTKQEAAARAQAAGHRSRVIEEDGQRFRVTKDYRPDRRNFTVKDGRVTRVVKG